MSNLVLPLAQVPAVISESLRAVLKAHRFSIADAGAGFIVNGQQLESLLNEVGRNAAQALYSIHIDEDDEHAKSSSRDACTLCSAAIVWARWATGRAMPMQLDPNGKWVIVDGVVRHRPQVVDAAVPRYVNHFLLCPQADNWRNRK